MIPLFDANAHPTLSGRTHGQDTTFARLSRDLKQNGFAGACAVGLHGTGDYDDQRFMTACRPWPELIPVAAWGDVAERDIERRIEALCGLGYRAIKIHPRLTGLSVSDARFRRVVQHAAAAGLVIFHCSYQFSNTPSIHPVDPLPVLLEIFASVDSARIVLLHGGTVELMRYAEAVRPFKNLLLDLSFTINRFAGSSLDQDIAYLFRSFDQRICIGSDFPDYGCDQLRQRFDAFAEGLPPEKQHNIGWRNITAFLGYPAWPADGAKAD
ncbi:MAG TPA: amidohydrolase family protein [Dongiaceae bacterium]|nr:amidohydrolase family protein [Dongiaceae bacterium]